MNAGGLDEKIPVAVLILPLILAFQPYLLIGPFRGGRAPAVMLSQSLKRELNYQS